MSRPKAAPAVFAILLALAFSAVRLSGQETKYYSSDEAGFQGEELRGLQPKGYTLAIAVSPSSTLGILYSDGKELRRTLRAATADGTRESVFEGSRLREERTYDRAGNLVEEFLYEGPSSSEGRPETGAALASAVASAGGPPGAPLAPKLVSRLVYTYRSGRLASVESFDASSRSMSGSTS